MTSPKRIAILGSTGSIGKSALRVVSAFRGQFEVAGLTTDRNVPLLAEQIREFRPDAVGVVRPESLEELKSLMNGRGRNGPRIYGGVESLEKVASAPGLDLVLSGVVGAVGLKALLKTLGMGRTVALANKESLIMAGELVTRAAREGGATLLPVDSEHSAMFQCLQGQAGNPIRKIILTASGGPFYRFRGDLSKVTVKKALAHPNWVMGKKITIDSATLMNKGLEAIEAHYLFGVPLDRIEIVIHRQSIVHSAIEFEDGSVIAQLSAPDMCLPIQYALTYPARRPCPVRRLDLAALGRLDFARPDFRKFPCLGLALSAGRAGGSSPCVLSASNEVAVQAFLAGRIRFTGIARVVEKVLSSRRRIPKPDLEAILDEDAAARRAAREIIEKMEVPN